MILHLHISLRMPGDMNPSMILLRGVIQRRPSRRGRGPGREARGAEHVRATAPSAVLLG